MTTGHKRRFRCYEDFPQIYIFSNHVDSGMKHSSTGIMKDVKNGITKLQSKIKAEKEQANSFSYRYCLRKLFHAEAVQCIVPIGHSKLP